MGTSLESMLEGLLHEGVRRLQTRVLTTEAIVSGQKEKQRVCTATLDMAYPPIRPAPDHRDVTSGGFRSHYHSHRYHELLICYEGVCELETIGSSVQIHPGEVVLVSPFCTHGGAWHQIESSGQLVWVIIDPPMIGMVQQVKSVDGKALKTHFIRDERRSELLRSLCVEATYEGKGLKPYFAGMCLEMIRRALNEGGAYRSDLQNRIDAVRAMKDYICEHLYDETMDLPGVAQMIGYSTPHAGRVFQEVCGRSFRSYLQGARIHRAREMLLFTEWPVRQIAEHVGVPDPFYFSRLFKQLVGASPTTYRQSFGSWIDPL